MSGPDHQELYRLVGELKAEVRALCDEQKLLRGDVVALKAQANRWKGAFGVLLMLGGFLGWIVSWFLKLLLPPT